jgi:LacI family transcriptional regulator
VFFLILSKQRVTSKQVAQRAGVSQSTVSFVLNKVGSANISEETSQRVWAAARDLGYVPNVAARALARGKNNLVALILDHPHTQIFLDEYIPKVITGLSQVMQQNGYRIMVEMLDDSNFAKTYVNLIEGGEVAGIVLNYNDCTRLSLDVLAEYSTKGFPIVTLDQSHSALHCVTVNKYDGVRQIVQHLIDLGHKRIACIAYGPVVPEAHIHRRLQVYQATLEAAGLVYDETLLREGDYDPETGYSAMISLLDGPVQPTAVYAMNDLMAFGALKAIQERGLRVPEDIAVVGFDDARLAAFSQPPLTTVFEPDVEHGRLAGETLLKLINGQPVPEMTIQLATTLVIRDSCGFYQQQKVKARLLQQV